VVNVNVVSEIQPQLADSSHAPVSADFDEHAMPDEAYVIY